MFVVVPVPVGSDSAPVFVGCVVVDADGAALCSAALLFVVVFAVLCPDSSGSEIGLHMFVFVVRSSTCVRACGSMFLRVASDKSRVMFEKSDAT